MIFLEVLNLKLNYNLGYTLYFLSLILIRIYITPISEFLCNIGLKENSTCKKNWENTKIKKSKIIYWIIKNQEKKLKYKDENSIYFTDN